MAARSPPPGRPPPGKPRAAGPPGVSLNRALSKLGLCSRTQAQVLIAAGRVRVGGKVVCDAALRVDMNRDRIVVDGDAVVAERKVYLMLNKPRGLVTTRDDPRQRDTVYACLEGLDLPYVSPVGRLDKASEGLLLMTNDTHFANRLMDPASHLPKTYHVQVATVPDDVMLGKLRAGVTVDGETLASNSIGLLRSGGRTAWLKIVLDEGKNRHIRRLLAAHDIEVKRLIRIAIGGLPLGDLAKGAARHLTAEELALLAQ
ncbi:pseudouridine synthase [Mesorhizobium sp. B2-3-12]|uniref:pseudouridine synthase n=1 Tax=Mesorhizobium sp. B2-3-12 TaxID=2589952 RepID=UPI00112B9D43|nr:pseudouridine synthase [Mesorhizobium sp. B2-3-12]TPL86179.1 rRNA pseudouridine synthase [Mesorhizobium sp. B2-3-12]